MINSLSIEQLARKVRPHSHIESLRLRAEKTNKSIDRIAYYTEKNRLMNRNRTKTGDTN